MRHSVRLTVEKLHRRLALISPLVYRDRRELPPFHYRKLPDASLYQPATDPELLPGEALIPPHSYWGEWQSNFLLRTTFQVPLDWDPEIPVAMYLPLGIAGDFSHPEALAYIDEQAYAACDRHHQEIFIPPAYCDGKEHQLVLHGWTGLGGWSKMPDKTQLYMRPCELVQIDPPARRFATLARLVLGTIQQLETGRPEKASLLNGLDAAFNCLDIREPLGERFYASLPAATQQLEHALEAAGPPMPVDITAAGHAHLDVAWLWTLDQTRRKSARTFTTVVRLMERFPDFSFTQSQPQLYEFIRRDDPGLFEAIRQRVVEGRWEPIGGMWVEADCNLTGAEALARQFLLGRNYFRRHFGPQAEAPVLWLPDVFGYTWSLPQLIRQAGLAYFFTIKIGWSQYNRLPYDSFWWQGLDGTRVLTHFSTTTDADNFHASTYNALLTPEEALRTWSNFQQQDLSAQGETPPLLMVYGYGDGGGGPTAEMLENLAEMDAFPGLPRVRAGTVGAFFEQLEAQYGAGLPVWNGELYLEYHRGTYTTQARTKRANRKTEFAMHDAEFIAAFAASLDQDYIYPGEAFMQAWESICLNQFHDIIPGSSIGAVYEQALEDYAQVQAAAQQACHSALTTIHHHIGGQLLLVNPVAFERDDLVLIPNKALPALSKPDGTAVLQQQTDQGTLLAAGNLPPFSVTPLVIGEGQSASTREPVRATQTRLENNFILAEFNPQGDLTRIYDKRAGRDILPPGQIANQFIAFEDRPLRWDAWDIDIFYDDKSWLAESAETLKVIENGPLRASLLIRRRLLNSRITQRISLAYNSSRLDFSTDVDWCERHILLKVAFPVEVLASQATYEIQWGHVRRPTHYNTSWDWARFETCAHKWVDLSEGGYGISLLNDGKYGHDIHDSPCAAYGVIRLSLLRSPTLPDPEADQGEHHFTYSLLPHLGPLGTETIRQAYCLNDPLFAYLPEKPTPLRGEHPSRIQAGCAWLRTDRENVVIETIKQARDGDGWIVRLYESLGQRGAVNLQASFPVSSVWRCNLMEENQETIVVEGNCFSFELRPFQILTLRLQPTVITYPES